MDTRDAVAGITLDRRQRSVGIQGLDDANVLTAEEDEVAGCRLSRIEIPGAVTRYRRLV